MSTFSQLNYKHGAAKLQSSSSTVLSLTGNDGGNILVQSATTGNFMPVALGPAGINQNLFNGTADVMFQPNQSLQAQTLYSVYLRNLDGTESGCVMSFWPTFQGYNPTIISSGDGMGMYVANTGGVNVGLMYLGQVFTGASDISTVIGPAASMRQPCYSQFNPWKFGFQTTPVVASAFTTAQNGVQASPTI